MELSQNERKAIDGDDGLLQYWLKNEKVELEATFGEGGTVDIQTFLRVFEYLQKVRKLIPSEPSKYLTISVDKVVARGPPEVKERFRFEVKGQFDITRYCTENILQEGSYTAMKKAKTDKQPIQLSDYSVKIKTAIEEDFTPNPETGEKSSIVDDILKIWQITPKYFRLITRWSFVDTKRNVRYDLSMVRSTDAKRAEKRPVYQFTPKSSGDRRAQDILNHSPTFEIEVELLRPIADKAAAWKSLMYSVVDVLRAIQSSSNLITKSERNAIQEAYRTLVNIPTKEEGRGEKDSKDVGFIGVNPVTLKLENVSEEVIPGQVNIRSVIKKADGKTTTSYYNVTDKADGLRCFGYTAPNGEFYLLDMSLNVYKTGLMNDGGKNSLVDGEYITKAGHTKASAVDTLYVFDIYYLDKQTPTLNLPFMDGTSNCRYQKMRQWMSAFTNSSNKTFAVELKSFEFAKAKEGEESIFAKAAKLWSARDEKPYHTDGLILTPNLSPLPDSRKKKGQRWNEQFKWKPADQNTIDFLVVFDKDQYGESTFEETKGGRDVQIKRMNLFVASDKLQNPRETYLKSMSLDFLQDGKNYRPVLFNPMDPPDLQASKCRVELMKGGDVYVDSILCEDSKEIIYDQTIVEMAYDPKREVGWRWYPMRVRQDKTERFRRAIAERKKINRVMNDAGTANDVWNSIHNPVTEDIITTGVIPPTIAAKPSLIQESYYERDAFGGKKVSKDKDKTNAMRDFHKKIIKGKLLFNAIKLDFDAKKRTKTVEFPTLIDLACGIGGDITRYVQAEPHAVLGIDKSGKNILDPDHSAYRFLFDNVLAKGNPDKVPSMFFVIGDSSKDIPSGECSKEETIEGANVSEVLDDAVILQYLFGQPQDRTLELERLTQMGHVFQPGADAVVLMFALHYFFKSKETFDGLLKNLDKILKVGGIFTGCNFDGDMVYDELKTKEQIVGEVPAGKQKEIVWRIDRKYTPSSTTIPSDEENTFGLQIDVQFKSISEKSMPEYLVSWDYLVSALKGIGIVLLSDEEAKAVGLRKSTEMFKTTYEALDASERPAMEPALRDYSFLNRWWVFKRTSRGSVTVETPSEAPREDGRVEEVASVPTAAAVGLPAAKSIAKQDLDFSDLSKDKIPQKILTLITGEGKPFASAPKPSEFYPLLSPLDTTSYTYDGKSYSTFYFYFYGRMLRERGYPEIARRFEVDGEYGLLLRQKVTAAPKLALQRTGATLVDILKNKDVKEAIATASSGWSSEQTLLDAFTQRYSKDGSAKKLLCFLEPLVNFQYDTTIEKSIGKKDGGNRYGQLLQTFIKDTLC